MTNLSNVAHRATGNNVKYWNEGLIKEKGDAIMRIKQAVITKLFGYSIMKYL